MAFTRAVIVRWPIPPSDPEVPSTGFPPLTIMPASGWNARIASTAVLHASVAGWEAGMLHCGSWAARDAASDKRATIVVRSEERRVGKECRWQEWYSGIKT